MSVKRGENGNPPIRLSRGGQRPAAAGSGALPRVSRPPQVEAGDSLFGPGRQHGKADVSRDQVVTPWQHRSDEETRILTPAWRGNTDSRAGQHPDPMADPPVGWLVIVRGPGKGRVLTLGNGMNSIGRGENSRLRLDFGDAGISRENHARIAYEPRQRCFLLSHGESANLTYLDGEVVMQTERLQSGAEIQLGNTVLRFQGLCSAAFDWPDVEDTDA